MTDDFSRTYQRTSAIPKRSLMIHGVRTSVSLEEEFWVGLKEIAAAREKTVNDVATQIDVWRLNQDPPPNMSSAIRLYVLADLQAKARA